MRLLQFATPAPSGMARQLGALISGDADHGEVVDLTAAARALLAHEGVGSDGARRIAGALVPPSLLGLVQAGARGRDLAEQALAAVLEQGWDTDPSGAVLRYGTDEITLRPAISEPPMLRDFMGFEQHLRNIFPKLGREIPQEWYRRPVYYKANTASLGAHGDPIALPSYADQLDLEFEFAAILGRGGTDIAVEDAAGHIFGYTLYDDFSARAVQTKEMTVGLGPAKGKDFHAGHVLGPIVVTADEVGDPYALDFSATVNGEQWTSGSTDTMHWRFEQMIAYASDSEPLRAGEVFGSGTVGGGSGAEQDRWLVPGDVVELTMAGLGALRNTIVAARETAAPARHEEDRRS